MKPKLEFNITGNIKTIALIVDYPSLIQKMLLAKDLSVFQKFLGAFFMLPIFILLLVMCIFIDIGNGLSYLFEGNI